MTTQNNYEKLLNDYRDLQLRVTRFSFIEQQLVNTRDQLDHELVLYKRLSKYNKNALKELSEIEFIKLTAESIIDILEVEFSVFYIKYDDHTKDSLFHVEGKNFDTSYEKIFFEDIKKLATKSINGSVEILPKRIFNNYKSFNILSDGIIFNFIEKDLGYSISLIGFTSTKKSPLYQKLDNKHETIFDIFGQQVQSLLANRNREEKIKEQIEKISTSEIELKKLSLIATKTKNGVIISDKEGKIEWVNDSFTKTTGYSINEVVGKKPKDFLQKRDVNSSVQQQLSIALSKRENIEVKIVNFAKNGIPYHNLIEIVPVYDDNGNHINFISLQKDITAETMYQEEILRINSRYELISAISNIGIWEWDEEKKRTVFNDTLLTLYGTTRKEIGNNFSEFWNKAILEKDRLIAIKGLERIRNGEVEFIEQEYRILRQSDKTIRILKCLTIAEKNYEGKIFRIVGSAIDVTETRESEIKLIASEKKYRNIIENMSLGLVEVNLNEKVVFNNKKFEQLTQLEDASTLTIMNTGISSLQNKVDQKIILSYKRIDESVYEIEYKRKDNKIIHLLVSAAPAFNIKGEITGFIYIYLDITSVKALQNNLEKAVEDKNKFISEIDNLKSFYESILNHSPAKIAVFNPNLTLSYANEQLSFLDFINTKNHGKTLMEIGNKNKNQKEKILHIINCIKSSINENRMIQFEDLINDNDGKTNNILYNVLPHFDINNELQHVIVSGVNITDLKTIQNDVQNKNLELKKINGELDNFVYRVSHDLRAPLLSIKGILSLIFHSENLNDGFIEYLNLIQNSVLRLDETIQEILEYSRNARLELRLEKFNIEEMVKEIYDDLKFTTANEINFSMSIEGSAFLESDKSRLNTVLKNLIGNSVKYKKNNRNDCIVELTLKRKKEFTIISIRDNGEGISQKSLPRVFEMFFRGTSTGVGTGLGLYITKEILNKLQGNIEASSELGVGTTMTIKLPNLNLETNEKVLIN